MPTLTSPGVREASGDSTQTMTRATEVLAPRWALPEPLVTVALADMAQELGVDVDDLAALVVRTSLG